MIVCVDLRKTGGRVANLAQPARFGFYDTERAGFVRLGVFEAWAGWLDFEGDYLDRYGPPSPARALHPLEAFRRACPPWVFQYAEGAEL